MNQKSINQRSHDLMWKALFEHLAIPHTKSHAILTRTIKKHYRPKSTLVSAGSHWDKLYFIQHGVVRMFYIDLQGREFNKAFFSDKQCIWPVTPRDRNQPVKFNIATITACTILECPIKHIYNFLQEHKLWEQFALPFAERLIEAKFRREHDFLLLSATERYQNFCREYPALLDQIPDYHLASLLGITNVSLSRIKSSLST